MKNYFQNIKLFIKSPLIFITCLLLNSMIFAKLLLVFHYTAAGAYTYHDYSVYFISCYLAVYYFIILLMTSFLFFRKTQSAKLGEIVYAIHRTRLERSQFAVLLTFHGCFSLVIYAVNFVAFWTGGYRDYAPYLVHTSIGIAVNYFLNGILAIMIGRCLTYLPGLTYQLAGGLLVSCMVSCSEWVYRKTISDIFYYLFEPFAVLPQGCGFVFNPYLGNPVQPHRMGLILFWLGILMIICAYMGKKKTILGAAITIVSICMLLLPYEGLMPIGSYLSRQQWDNRYYVNEKAMEQAKEEKAEFQITEYDLDFSVQTCLKAKAVLSLSGEAQEEYCFTLYHPYKVSRILDQEEKKLKFTQKGDYITVRNPEGSKITEMTFFYSGNGKQFYSQSQGIYLNYGVAFYPIAGFHALYREEAVEFAGEMININCMPDVFPEGKPYFKVRIHTGQQVYSSLPETERNYFEGRAEGFCLLSGFVASRTVGDVTFIYPVLRGIQDTDLPTFEDVVEYADLLEQEYGNPDFIIHNKKVLIMPANGSQKCEVIAKDDYVILYESIWQGDVEQLYGERK